MPEKQIPVPCQPGQTRCLRCDKWFQTPNVCTIRICPVCKAKPEKLGIMSEFLSHSGVDLPEDRGDGV